MVLFLQRNEKGHTGTEAHLKTESKEKAIIAAMFWDITWQRISSRYGVWHYIFTFSTNTLDLKFSRFCSWSSWIIWHYLKIGSMDYHFKPVIRRIIFWYIHFMYCIRWWVHPSLQDLYHALLDSWRAQLMGNITLLFCITTN